MRLGLFSDAHAYPDRLERAVKALEKLGVDTFVCLGDTVGYGPDPVETVRLVRSVADVVIKGNHDSAVAEGVDRGNFARDETTATILGHRASLSRNDIDWLVAL